MFQRKKGGGNVGIQSGRCVMKIRPEKKYELLRQRDALAAESTMPTSNETSSTVIVDGALLSKILDCTVVIQRTQ